MRTIVDAVLLGISGIVDEHPPADDAASSMPMVDAIVGAARDVRAVLAMIELPGGLVRIVLEAIPLTARLRVDVQQILVDDHLESAHFGLEALDVMVGLLATKGGRARELDGQIQRDADALFDLLASLLDDLGGQQVQSAALISLAVPVPQAPRTALGHALDVGEFMVRRQVLCMHREWDSPVAIWTGGTLHKLGLDVCRMSRAWWSRTQNDVCIEAIEAALPEGVLLST